MKGKKDPYTGFAAEEFNARRRLSIAAICSPSDAPTAKVLMESVQPTAILAEDGSVLCGCGCAQPFDSCPTCFRELCQGYYTLSH
ncbi:hypothetical protein EC973_005808 [Apophysomyces ossiformis]|uniref:Uncharacterized protein n=1 Tax=Apophysomyces ossiformis TaxID=679940 RepID=A0A8H7BTZ4_9FUNG|nr:hypothetical protein EC973_005808 [Apophysomyces ossiformis]